jgi:hypothetical protein
MFALLTITGLAGLCVCTVRHYCMCGHMAHPPFHWWDYANDILWVSLFIAAAIVAAYRWHEKSFIWVILLGAVIVSRFALTGCMAMPLWFIELPAAAALFGRSVWALIEKPSRRA